MVRVSYDFGEAIQLSFQLNSFEIKYSNYYAGEARYKIIALKTAKKMCKYFLELDVHHHAAHGSLFCLLLSVDLM